MECPASSKDEQCLSMTLNLKLIESNDLLSQCDNLISRGISGAEKLKRKILVEQANLKNLQDNILKLKPQHLHGSNLNHFKALLETIEKCHDVLAILVPFKKSDDSILYVDIVASNGATWTKVVARNAKGLHMSFTGQSTSKEKNIIKQADDYIDAAMFNPHHFKTPKIQFNFTAGLTAPIKRELAKLGIESLGDIIDIENDDEDLSASETSSDSESEKSDSFEDQNQANCNATTLQSISTVINEPSINLDITAFFALISNLTHGHCNYQFEKSLILDEQAAWERKNPVLSGLQKLIEGKKLICCQTAFDSFNEIVKTVGGPEEIKRAKLLLEKITIVEDKITERIGKLHIGGKIKSRSKVIFGSGDYYQALTLTANKSFLAAADIQGVKIQAILHEPRALSEQKQQFATVIEE